MALLRVSDLCLRYGGVQALDHLSFEIAENQAVALIGPNGAGKTSLFNCLTGFARPQKGSMRLAGQELRGLPPQRLVSLGLVRTFQNLRLFPGLTVEENVLLGLHSVSRQGLGGALLRTRACRQEEAALREQARRCLAWVELSDWRRHYPPELPYGLQRRVEWARALAAQPRLLLLDEPAAGLNREEKQQLIALIAMVRQERPLTLLLIEHDVELVMTVAQRLIVLDFGRKIAEGEPAQVRQEPQVIRAYLGGQA